MFIPYSEVRRRNLSTFRFRNHFGSKEGSKTGRFQISSTETGPGMGKICTGSERRRNNIEIAGT